MSRPEHGSKMNLLKISNETTNSNNNNEVLDQAEKLADYLNTTLKLNLEVTKSFINAQGNNNRLFTVNSNITENKIFYDQMCKNNCDFNNYLKLKMSFQKHIRPTPT